MFGIVSAVFTVLRKPILVQPDSAKKITSGCAHLHNSLSRSTSQQLHTPPRTFDACDVVYDTLIPGSGRQDEVPPVQSTLLLVEPTQKNSNIDDRNTLRNKPYIKPTI